jgi:predicted lipoprotein with Yx(FWY)xxD motif
MRIRWQAPAVLAMVALTAAACGSSGSSGTSGSGSSSSGASSSSAAATPSAGAATSALKTGKVSGVTVLTNAKGLTLYWFAPDTATTSKCNGTCAHYWPPVPGPATAGTGVTGKLSTIKRSDGSVQAAYNGHPLYTYIADTSPGMAKGNGLNLSGGVWHEVTVSGAAAPGTSSSSGGGGY